MRCKKQRPWEFQFFLCADAAIVCQRQCNCWIERVSSLHWASNKVFLILRFTINLSLLIPISWKKLHKMCQALPALLLCCKRVAVAGVVACGNQVLVTA